MNHRIDIADLVRRSQAMAQGMAHGVAGLAGAPAGDGALREVAGFGSNPGALRMLEFVPADLPPGAPLVVALHGCTQTAGGYDRGSGWSTLAARDRFALLLPEQRPANNANRCFNWFEPGDTRRDAGEAASIRQMIAAMVERHRLDPKRVFISGLSAGGAMTSVMLATYPEVFAAGAIFAGLPYGAAGSVAEAFEAMATGRPRPARQWGDLVRAASGHRGAWPRVSVWQGDTDVTVRAANAAEIVKQWRDLHGLERAPAAGESRAPGHAYRFWRGADGRPVLEQHVIAGMGHGVPTAPGLGEPMPYFLDVGLGATEAIAAFFGLDARAAQEPEPASWLDRVITVARDSTAYVPPAPDRAAARAQPDAPSWFEKLLGYKEEPPAAARRPEAAEPPPAPEAEAEPGARPAGGRHRIDPGGVIRRALRAAGLLRG